MIVITIASNTGHLAMSQIVVAVDEIPSGAATASTIGPVRTSAPIRPTTNRMPAADWFDVIDLIGPAKVWALEEGPIWVTIWVIFWVVVWGSATRPRSETRAIRAGKSAKRP